MFAFSCSPRALPCCRDAPRWWAPARSERPASPAWPPRRTGAAPARWSDDEVIELKAIAALRRNTDIAPASHVNATSYNGILLLTGETPNEEMRGRITGLVENIHKVRRVQNELAIAAPSSMLSRSSDAIITAKIKTALGRHSFEIAARTKVVTENGVVYLLGLVRRGEADVATGIARQIGGVQRVVKLFEYID